MLARFLNLAAVRNAFLVVFCAWYWWFWPFFGDFHRWPLAAGRWPLATERGA